MLLYTYRYKTAWLHAKSVAQFDSIFDLANTISCSCIFVALISMVEGTLVLFQHVIRGALPHLPFRKCNIWFHWLQWDVDL
jgi:hypothetical protein